MSKAAGAVVAAGLGLVGLGYGGLSGEDNTTRNDAGEIVDAGGVGAFRIRVGDCFQDPDFENDGFESVEAVPCSVPHANEAYAAFNLDGDTFPGDTRIGELADEGCYQRFEPFVGMAYQDSTLSFWVMFPSEGSWEELNDREVVCAVYNTDESPQVGSVRNSAR